MHVCSFCDALAETVMMALMKSAAEVWVDQLCSGPRKEIRVGMTSCV